MSDWRHCIVSLIDVIDLKSLASRGDGKASAMMREMHNVAYGYATHVMKEHAHAYLWNDSALLLAYVDQDLHQAQRVLIEVDELKKRIDAISQSYAISVKGKAFPDLDPWRAPGFDGQIADQPRAMVIKASSFAMANCFLIEETLGRKLKKPWAVDSRIARCIRTPQKYIVRTMQLLPNERRQVRLYSSYLW